VTEAVSRTAAGPDVDLAKARLRTWLRILKTARHVEKELRERFRDELDSTLPRFDVMSALDRHREGLKMTELSSELRVSNGNITGIVDRLVEAQLVERRSVEGDRRAQLICLTPLGIETFAHHARTHEEWVDELLGAIDPLEADHLMALLDLITARPATTGPSEEDR